MAKRLVDPCDWCRGNGEIVCSMCGGHVRVGGTTGIPRSDGFPGWTRCPQCEGTGAILCPQCKGRRKYYLHDNGYIE